MAAEVKGSVKPCTVSLLGSENVRRTTAESMKDFEHSAETGLNSSVL